MARVRNYCMLSGVEARPGEWCPVHRSAACLVRGWLTELPAPTLRQRLARWWGTVLHG